MAGLAIQQTLPPVPGMASIKKGDILPGSVVEKINAFQFKVKLGGIETLVNTRLPIKVGQRLLLRVEAFSPRLKLKLMATPHILGNQTDNWIPITRALGVKNDPLSFAIIEQMLLFHLPLRKNWIRSIRQEILRLRHQKKLPVELLLKPIGIWYDALPDAFYLDPLFLARWYWQDEWQGSSTPYTRSASEDESTLLILLKQLQAIVRNGSPLTSWPELGVIALRQYIEKFYRISNFSGTEWFKFKFITQQWKRLLNGQWALFTVAFNEREFFLHLRQTHAKDQWQLIVDFNIPSGDGSGFQVRTIFNKQALKVLFWNDHQALRDAVDNEITLFLEKLEGITKFRSITIKPDPHLTAYQGLRDYYREIKLKYTGAI